MTAEQQEELRNLKAHFPFRIIWGARSPSGEWITGANFTKRQANDKMRQGWRVWIAS